MTSLLLDTVTSGRRVKWQGHLEVMFFLRCTTGLGAQGVVPGGHSRVRCHFAHATVSLLRRARPGVFPEVVLQMLWLYESRLGAHPARQALTVWQEETCLLHDAYIFRRHCLITYQPILWLSLLQKRKKINSTLEENQHTAPSKATGLHGRVTTGFFWGTVLWLHLSFIKK